jgi:hypothetical protein
MPIFLVTLGLPHWLVLAEQLHCSSTCPLTVNATCSADIYSIEQCFARRIAALLCPRAVKACTSSTRSAGRATLIKDAYATLIKGACATLT